MAHSRNIYLKMKSITEAKSAMRNAVSVGQQRAAESVPVIEAVGRVLSDPVYARRSSPAFNTAAMDGIAVAAASTYGAAENRPVNLAVGKEAFWVNTGHVLPDQTDAVIMIENLTVIDEDQVQIEAPAFPDRKSVV